MARKEIDPLLEVSTEELERFRQLDLATQKAVLNAMAAPLDNPRLSARDRAIAKTRIKAYRNAMKSRQSGR
jgi:hypothetical protein